jgi:hypothetical protein
MTSMILGALGAPLGALVMATLLGAMLAPLGRSAKRVLPRAQRPGDPVPSETPVLPSRAF